ncbi:hypothetical protein ACFSTA_20355 [Ornithinibacillus salinisoli]|uniref:DUF262 domain-containing protein n=1 Tax=Ornithinibacillus salinisoli TaxID=1848459 RepID=A0ABW4W6C1_9BACI
MESSELIKKLKPYNNNTLDKEPFESYKLRVAHLLPNFPVEVLEQWIYRHYSDINDYSFLGLENMAFTEIIMKKDDIYNNIKSYDDKIIDSLGYQIYERSNKTWLQKKMISQFTWPVPIIVYKNYDNPDMGKPYHLIEGHLRLNYFRAMYRREKNILLDNHRVWEFELFD